MATDDADDHLLESRLRHLATKRGYALKKSRQRDPAVPGYGGYMLVNIERNAAVLGYETYFYSASLKDIEEFLNGPGQAD